jgi:hypothetical protein
MSQAISDVEFFLRFPGSLRRERRGSIDMHTECGIRCQTYRSDAKYLNRYRCGAVVMARSSA